MIMKICDQGSTRLVFLIGRYAIKFATIEYGQRNLLKGMYANYTEREISKYGDEYVIGLIAKTIYCSLFGLFSIQERVSPLLRDLTSKEVKKYSFLCGQDSKKENFGMKNGVIVCVDYPAL